MATKNEHPFHRPATTEGLPVAPSLEPALEQAHISSRTTAINFAVVRITFIAMGVAVAAAIVAQGLTALIGFITNLAFYGKISADFVSPAGHHLGVWVVGVPVIGGLIVGFMARYGAKEIRGHGIPEAMEQVLLNKSRISPKITFLKPLSAAIAIGTGGPFGAEGPIIATGGSLGSLVGQFLKTTSEERKVLLAAGAAAGMTATFGSPVSAILLAIELLLFEYRPRSFVPIAMACVVAEAVRIFFAGDIRPVFAMADVVTPTHLALLAYTFIGIIIGFASIFVTRAIYFVEDAFDRLPVHWMWWPALGGLAVGLIGYFLPTTMGVGYDNIEHIVNDTLAEQALLALCVFKFISWAIALGSGTSGGTLAPLFTIGGALGALTGSLILFLFPDAQVDVRVAALVGMAAIFAGASRALLASIVFAFETTLQPLSLLPLLAGCTTSYLVSSLFMKQSIMTEKISRRGVEVPNEYSADLLTLKKVKEHASYHPITLNRDDSIGAIRHWLASGKPGSQHQGFPVVDKNKKLTGVIARRDIFEYQGDSLKPISDLIQRKPVIVAEDDSIRTAVDFLAHERIGRLAVVKDKHSNQLVGMITRSDILAAYAHLAKENKQSQRTLRFGKKERND